MATLRMPSGSECSLPPASNVVVADGVPPWPVIFGANGQAGIEAISILTGRLLPDSQFLSLILSRVVLSFRTDAYKRRMSSARAPAEYQSVLPNFT